MEQARETRQAPVVKIELCDYDAVKSFFGDVFQVIPDDLLNDVIQQLRTDPAEVFVTCIKKVTSKDCTSLTKEFSLIMLGVSLAVGSTNPQMGQAFKLARKINDLGGLKT